MNESHLIFPCVFNVSQSFLMALTMLWMYIYGFILFYFQCCYLYKYTMALTLTDTNVFICTSHTILYLSLGDAHFPVIQLQIINEQMKYSELRSMFVVRVLFSVLLSLQKSLFSTTVASWVAAIYWWVSHYNSFTKFQFKKTGFKNFIFLIFSRKSTKKPIRCSFLTRADINDMRLVWKLGMIYIWCPQILCIYASGNHHFYGIHAVDKSKIIINVKQIQYTHGKGWTDKTFSANHLLQSVFGIHKS